MAKTKECQLDGACYSEQCLDPSLMWKQSMWDKIIKRLNQLTCKHEPAHDKRGIGFRRPMCVCKKCHKSIRIKLY